MVQLATCYLLVVEYIEIWKL